MSQIAPAQHITLGQFLKAHAVEASLAVIFVALEVAWLGTLAVGIWKAAQWLLT
ncbi:hypothetical protein [Bosea sp. AS-1]|jgi:hypothetical protein|uniref:hypothetical protein n=1 Tax=Bosea sp. AS-1 TaxID=2015316 RepID=UPI0012FE03BD|nr:hypothetical protein [Bosea sp. AS-1]